MAQGERLKKILKDKGITQQELADGIDVNRTYITNQLKLPNLSRKLIDQIATFLQVDSDELEKQLQVDPEKSDYIVRLEESLDDKIKIIALLEEQVEYWKSQAKKEENSTN